MTPFCHPNPIRNEGMPLFCHPEGFSPKGLLFFSSFRGGKSPEESLRKEDKIIR